jgi:plastocyanin domain-containing protein
MSLSLDIILVDLAVIGAIAWVVWYFWFSEKQAVRAVTAGGAHFDRQETASCSEMVVFPDFDVSRRLPAGELVTIELTPEAPGEYEFSCQMGMLRGRLIAN